MVPGHARRLGGAVTVWTIARIRFWIELSYLLNEAGSVYIRMSQWCGRRADRLLNVPAIMAGHGPDGRPLQ